MTPTGKRWGSVPVENVPVRRSDDSARQALRLRKLGLSYPSISVVMAEYHDVAWGPDTWRRILRDLGAQPIRCDYVGQATPPGLAAYRRHRAAAAELADA